MKVKLYDVVILWTQGVAECHFSWENLATWCLGQHLLYKHYYKIASYSPLCSRYLSNYLLYCSILMFLIWLWEIVVVLKLLLTKFRFFLFVFQFCVWFRIKLWKLWNFYLKVTGLVRVLSRWRSSMTFVEDWKKLPRSWVICQKLGKHGTSRYIRRI